LRDEAVQAGLPFADDPANIDDRFLRSRVRNHLLPMIESEFGEGFKENLARSAGLVRDDDQVLEHLAAAFPVRVGTAEVGLPVALLTTQPEAIAARVVRRGLSQIHHPYHGSYGDVVAVIATANDGVTRTLSSDIECVREGPEVVLVTKSTTDQPREVNIAVGETLVWDGTPFSVRTTTEPAMQSTTPRRTAIDVPDGRRLGVRAVRDGDRIDIENGTTPVSEVLRAGDVPARKRARWMLITVDGKIAAVHGLKVAPWARPVRGHRSVVIELEGRT
jgi:hypothetical protein